VLTSVHVEAVPALGRALRVRMAALSQIRVLCTGKPRLDAQLARLYVSIPVTTVPVLPAWIGPDGINPVAYWAQVAAAAMA